MKKLIVLTAILSLFSYSQAQLTGDLKTDNRSVVSEQSFVMEGIKDGTFVFDISVNAEGEITAAKKNDKLSTIKSTPAEIQAYNHVKEFRFEPGTWFPKFHQGRIKITMTRKR